MLQKKWMLIWFFTPHETTTLPKLLFSQKTFLEIILAAKWIVRHSSTSAKQQRRPFASLLSVSSSKKQKIHNLGCGGKKTSDNCYDNPTPFYGQQSVTCHIKAKYYVIYSYFDSKRANTFLYFSVTQKRCRFLICRKVKRKLHAQLRQSGSELTIVPL